MKGLKGLMEIHEIKEKVYEEERGLSPLERIKRLREESERFMQERGLNLRRARPRELKSTTHI